MALSQLSLSGFSQACSHSLFTVPQLLKGPQLLLSFSWACSQTSLCGWRQLRRRRRASPLPALPAPRKTGAPAEVAQPYSAAITSPSCNKMQNNAREQAGGLYL